jgi:glyoxylase-like metal-dependent hydrolase (beta-lactamase superfamily II)
MPYIIHPVGALAGSEAFLLLTPEKSALLDSGFSFCAEAMLDKVSALLGTRSLDYVLLTHSHYDHASGSAYCHRRWPDVCVVASAYAAKVLAKDSVRATMRELNAAAAALNGCRQWVDRLDELTVHRCVEEGDELDLGSISLRVLAAPGHTRCSIMFYAPAAALLLSCETLGVHAGPGLVMPCCLVGYQQSLQALDRVMAMPLRSMLLPHHGLIHGDQCQEFLRDSRYWLVETHRRVHQAHADGASDAELHQLLRELFYTDIAQLIQPEQAFELNASYTIPLLLRE